MDATVCVGTAGMSVWFSDDRGETWTRPYSESGLYLESRVWSLADHPDRPGEVLAGTDLGLYRARLAEKAWTHVPSPMDDRQIWSLAMAPWDPDLMVAGTQPAGIFRSTDGGRTWSEAKGTFAEACIFVHKPRVTQILFDPEVRGRVWCGIEIDGIHRSDDGGASWTKVAGEGLVSEDIHGICITTEGGRRLWAATNKGFHVSTDDGATFTFRKLDAPSQYTRSVLTAADGEGTMYLTSGNGPPGDDGRLLRSTDHAETWVDVGLPGKLNSTPWCVAAHKADPKLLFCASNLGQLFRSTDGGATWTKLARELGEVRTILWAPR